MLLRLKLAKLPLSKQKRYKEEEFSSKTQRGLSAKIPHTKLAQHAITARENVHRPSLTATVFGKSMAPVRGLV